MSELALLLSSLRRRRVLPFVLLAGSVTADLSIARADIGFLQAAATARLVFPDKPLVALGHRIGNGNGNPTIYTTGSINEDGTLMYGLDLHATTGGVLAMGFEAVLPPEDVMMRDVLARYPLVTIDFATALQHAREYTGRPDILVDNVSLASELFMLFYDLRYTDNLRLMVDAITGQVVPVVETASTANSITPLAFTNAVNRANALAGAGWHAIMAETAVTQGGLAIGITMLDPLTGRLKQVDTLGKQVEIVEFAPIGHLALVVNAIQGQFNTVIVTPQQFFAKIGYAYPGSKIASFGLSSRVQNNGTVRTTWSAFVLTALLQPLEYTIDATVPVEESLGVATVRVLFKDGDYNRDGHVAGDDLAELLAMFGQAYPPYDLNQDGMAQGEDLAILLSNWG